MRYASWAYGLFAASVTLASERHFDVKDDIFAFPQYEVEFPPSYFAYEDAMSRLAQSGRHDGSDDTNPPSSDQAQTDDGQEEDDFEYEYMVGNGRPYLCAIPHIKPLVDEVEEERTDEEKQQDLVAAADRGWQLLQEMADKQCLYYTTGWWSYSFCYNSYVKQYHASTLPNGARTWPPEEDTSTPSYILGKYDIKSHTDSSKEARTGELQTQAETTYLVQRLEDGTPCDLTGRPRKVEVQYHCNPQSTERIGWIKETATCAYLMVVYTPRLCNDIAFLPPKDAHVHTINCHEILTQGQIDSLDQETESSQTPAIDETVNERLTVGKIEVGGMKLIGQGGKKIEKGQIVMTPDERAETVILSKAGQVRGLSDTELKKMDLSPEEIESFVQELKKVAGSKDWKIQRLGNADGQVTLRGVVANDAGSEKEDEKKAETKDQREDEAEAPKDEA